MSSVCLNFKCKIFFKKKVQLKFQPSLGSLLMHLLIYTHLSTEELMLLNCGVEDS